eukprot:TRINITY_DN16716_c0_g1_i2.p1 TRINITY_DN16716_c0_g1~~TRINITY_DN16716_c0_g1_i2.p1  ORF type:complete len:161 (-),score=43.17 TRINITY_DN16716_c0_g1_i2:420-902(-)
MQTSYFFNPAAPAPETIAIPAFARRAGTCKVKGKKGVAGADNKLGAWKPLNVPSETVKVKKCASKLLEKPPEDLRSFIEEVAMLLLHTEEKNASLTYIGGRLSQEGRCFLRDINSNLGYILTCYSKDFRLNGPGHSIRVEYLHDFVKAEWDLYYEVHASL